MTQTHQDESLEILQECPVCRSTESTVVFTLPDIYISTSQLILNTCSNCAFTYLNPRLSFSAVEKLENTNEYYDYPPEQVESTITQLSGLVQFVEAYVPGKGQLLDFGCNRGFLLEAARQRGWQVTGIELSEWGANKARQDFGHQVFKNLEFLPEGAEFDAIMCWHVLEHMPNPVEFLTQIKPRLKEHGMIAIQVPSYTFLKEYEQRSTISSLVCSVHNSYFTEDSFRKVLDLAGFIPHWISDNPDDLMLTAICSKKTLRSSAERKVKSFGKYLLRRLPRLRALRKA